MAKTIPQRGDPFLGAQPAAIKVAVVRLYATASITSDCDTDDVEIAVVADTSAAAAAQHLFAVPAGTVVHDILINCATSWGDSTVCEFLLGDTTGNDTFLTDTQLGSAATHEAYIIGSVMELNASKTSRVYKTADYIDATWVINSSAFGAAGLTYFWLVYSNPF